MKGTEVQCRLHVTDVLAFLESIVFRDHGDIRKAGWGSSPWKHPHESQKNQTNAKLKKTNKTQTKNSGRVHSLTRVYFFPFKRFFSSKQFLNRSRVVWIFRSLFSSASLTYSHTENKCLCLISEDKKNKKKKALHIYIKKFGATFFSQSSQSSYTSVSRLSFLVI